MCKNTIFKKLALPLMCLLMLVGLSAPALAYTSSEIEDRPGTTNPSHTNDAIAAAEYLLGVNGTSNPSTMQGTIKSIDDNDYYRFLYQTKATSNGRFSIKLEGIQSGNSYNLYLLDANNNIILSSTRSGNQNQIIRVPANTLIDKTTYYIKIVPVTVSTPGTRYTLLMEDNMRTVTETASSATYSLNSFNGQMSTPALIDMRNKSKDPNATVLSVSVSANKSASAKAYNYVMYVSPNSQHNQWYTANWNSEVTGLKNANVLLKDYWNVAFSATSLISGVNVVSINSPKLTFTYEYDSTAGY